VPQCDLPASSKASGKCGCSSNLGAFGDALVNRLRPLYDEVRKEEPSSPNLDGTAPQATLDKLRLAGYQEMLFSRFEPVRDIDPNNPFIMATIDPDVVNGHSDIFNPRFMDFLIEYVIRSEIKRSLVNAYGPEIKK
jgi:hypothetical protein